MRRHLPTATAVVMLTGISVAAVHTLADAPAAASMSTLSSEQQTSALKFAQDHHPQLFALIRKLEKRDAAEYAQALADLSKTAERLARLQSRDPQRYEIELSLWKVDSRIRLLAARMAGDDRSSLENDLRSLLQERTELRLQQLANERDRLNARIERIDQQVSQLTGERDTFIDREVERLQRSVRSRTSNVSKQPNPGVRSAKRGSVE